MPIPEPGIYRRSNLTQQQRQDQVDAIYGVKKMPQLTDQEVNSMRELLAQHDAEQTPVKVVDLNNPPRLPYKFQKFPKIVYDLENSSEQKIVYVTVENEDDLQSYLAEGWSETPPSYSEQREEPLSAPYQMEVAQAEEKLAEARQKRTYNRKAS